MRAKEEVRQRITNSNKAHIGNRSGWIGRVTPTHDFDPGDRCCVPTLSYTNVSILDFPGDSRFPPGVTISLYFSRFLTNFHYFLLSQSVSGTVQHVKALRL